MYGKLIDFVLKLSKNYLIWNGRKIWNAPREMWISAGWKEVHYGEYPEGYTEYITVYSEDDENIYVTYEGVENED